MLRKIDLSQMEISSKEYNQILSKKIPHTLLDVRRKDEISSIKCCEEKFNFRKIIYIKSEEIITEIKKLLNDINKDSLIITMCRRGNRSLMVSCILSKFNFSNVKSLSCGINSLDSLD